MSTEQITYPDATKGYVPAACGVERCGDERRTAGALPRGWVRTNEQGEHPRWHCSWHCASRYAIRRELGGFTWAPEQAPPLPSRRRSRAPEAAT